MLKIFNELFIINYWSSIAAIKYISYEVVEIAKINTKGVIILKAKTFLFFYRIDKLILVLTYINEVEK